MRYSSLKSIILLIMLLFFAGNSFPAGEADSLRLLIEKSKGDKRIKLTIELMKKLVRSSPAEAILSGNAALNLLRSEPDNELEAEVYNYKGWAYHYLRKPDSAKIYADLTKNLSEDAGYLKGQVMSSLLRGRILRDEEHFDEAIKTLNDGLELNKKAGDTELEIKLLNETGSVFRRTSRYEEALNNHKKALEQLKEYNDEEELITTYTYSGIIYNIIGDYDEALVNYHKALELNKKNNNTRGIAGSVHNIGILYQKIAKYDLALDYYNQARSYWEKLNNESGLAATLNSIGAIHELQNSEQDALDYYLQALAIWEKSGNSYSVSIALNNIASVHEYLGNYNDAKKYIQRAISIREILGDKNAAASSMLVLSEIYNKIGLTDSAVATGKKALEAAEEAGSLTTIRQAHATLAGIYEKNNLFKEALNEYKNYIEVHDSMFNSESQQVIAEMQEKYNSEEQRREIELLQQENKIQNLYRTILISGIVLTVLIIILLYNRFRLSKKLHQSEIESANLKAVAAESKTAMIQAEFDMKKKELDAARDLQLSMLPSKIPEHPAVDISASMITATEVGGDYYDFQYNDNGKLTIAIGDATGHGAQAGIMVTAVKGLFNLLSDEDDITEILSRSTSAIKKMQFANLFMALGILRLHDHQLELAGAGMPPAYIYRAAADEVELIELKGVPVGIVSEFRYYKKRISLFKDDVVVLMSDGFPELFNAKKETLGFEKIPDLLKQAGRKSPEEIITFFKDTADNWLKGEKQQDDMTFVVFKVKK